MPQLQPTPPPRMKMPSKYRLSNLKLVVADAAEDAHEELDDECSCGHAHADADGEEPSRKGSATTAEV